MRNLLTSFAIGHCSEHMCQGTADHPCDHYVQRLVNGKTITTFWPKRRQEVRAQVTPGSASSAEGATEVADGLIPPAMHGSSPDSLRGPSNSMPPTRKLTEAELDVILDRAKKGWPRD